MNRGRLAMILVFGLLTAIGQSQTSGLQTGSPWPKFLGNTLNSSQGATGGSNGLSRWQFATGAAVYSSPAIDANGVVYVASTDGYLHAVNPNGTQKWEFAIGVLPPGIAPSPAIGADGTIYMTGVGFNAGVGGNQNVLYAINPIGTQKWKVVTEQSAGSPAIASDGGVYIAGYDAILQLNTLYAINPDGTPRWEFATGPSQGDAIESSPAVGPDGTIYAASSNNLYAIDATGVQEWSLSVATEGSSPAIGPDGTIYIGTAGSLLAVNSDGTKQWAFATQQPIVSSPAVAGDGIVYAGSLDGTLYAIDTFSGTPSWTFATGSPIYATPLIGSDGTVYVASESNLIAVSLLGTKVWKAQAGTGAVYSSPAIGADGALYLGSPDANLYAIGTEVNTIPTSSLSLSPGSVLEENAAVATVTLASPAPAGGDVVTLQSQNPAAQVPPFVIVPGGATTAMFSVTTAAVASSTPATITATTGGQTASAVLTIQPATLARLSFAPSSLLGGIQTLGTITLTGPGAGAGVTVGLTSATSNVVVPTNVTVAAGETSATFSAQTVGVSTQTMVLVTAEIGGISQSATLTLNPATVAGLSLKPNSVVGGVSSVATVTLAGAAGPGGAFVSLSSSNASASVPNSIVIPSGQSVGTFIVKTANVPGQVESVITATSGGASQTAELTIAPAVLAGMSLSPSTLTGGAAATGTVTMTGPAPAGGVVVSLSSNVKGVTVPSTVKVAAGSSSSAFTVKTLAVLTQRTATIEAIYKSSSTSAELTLNSPTLVSLSLNPTTVIGGSPSTGTVTLSGPAASTIVVRMATNLWAAVPPSSVTIPAGKSTAKFTVRTSAVGASSTATLTANLAGVSVTANLTIEPPIVVSLSVSPAAVVGGKPCTGTVTLSVAAPSGGVVVLVSSTNSATSVPASVTVPAGKTSAKFIIATSAVSAQTTAQVSASVGASEKSAKLVIAK